MHIAWTWSVFSGTLHKKIPARPYYAGSKTGIFHEYTSHIVYAG